MSYEKTYGQPLIGTKDHVIRFLEIGDADFPQLESGKMLAIYALKGSILPGVRTSQLPSDFSVMLAPIPTNRLIVANKAERVVGYRNRGIIQDVIGSGIEILTIMGNILAAQGETEVMQDEPVRQALDEAAIRLQNSTAALIDLGGVSIQETSAEEREEFMPTVAKLFLSTPSVRFE